MRYRIEYADGKCCNFANSSRDLIDWLKLLKDETISDIRKIYKNGATDSVKEKYQKQLMNNVHDIAYIRVLNQIYFLFHTPERAAQELKRSRSWIYTKHEEAVKAFEQGNEEFLNRWVIERMNNSEQIEQLMNQLYEIQQKKQQVEDEESEIRATLLETMKKEQIEKLENVKIKINYIDKSYRRTVNGKLLRELYPDAFRECTNRSEVQPHLRVQMMSA